MDSSDRRPRTTKLHQITYSEIHLEAGDFAKRGIQTVEPLSVESKLVRFGEAMYSPTEAYKLKSPAFLFIN